MKLTGWYKPSQKPVRNGYYECKCCGYKFYWNGKNWISRTWGTEITEIREGWRGFQK